MTRFVETTKGWINLATIERFVCRRRTGGLVYAAIPIGAEIDIEMTHTFDPDHDLATVIPAGYPIHVAVLGCFGEPGQPPKPEDVYLEFHPVAAWRLEYGSATPILTALDVSDQTVAIPLGDGKWQTDGEDVHDDLDALKAAVYRRAHHNWTQRQPQAADT